MFSYQDLEFDFSLKTITSFENCWIRLELETVLYLQALGWKYFLQILINNGMTYYLVHLSLSKPQHLQLKETVSSQFCMEIFLANPQILRYIFMLMQVIMLPHFPLLHNSLSSLLHAVKFLHCPSTIPCFFKALLASAHHQQLIFQGFTVASPHVQNSVLTTFCYLTKALKTKIIHFFNLMNFWFDQVVISLVSFGVSNVAEIRGLSS